MILAGVPRLLKAALKGRSAPLALALELSVPPLSALVLAAGLVFGLLVVWSLFGGSWEPVAVLGGVIALAVFGLGAAWLRFGRATLPARTLFRAPFYVLRKLPLYAGFIFRPQRDWVRTQRDGQLPAES